MIILKKIWGFIKKCWYVPVAIMVSIITFLTLRADDSDSFSVLEISEDSKEKQVTATLDAEKEKIEAKDEIEEEYENAVKKIEEEYATMGKELEDSQRDRIRWVVKTFNSNPDIIAEKLSKKFGVNYVPSNKNSSDNDS